jgi:predicted dehydrogenase
MTVRVGILGASRIAELAIVGPARELGCRFVAIAARDPRRARVFADVVYHPLANALHAPWNPAAIAAGKPVLTEKPFARNHAEAQRVHDAAEAAGVTVMEGVHYLFHPVARRILDLATSKERGRLQRVEVRTAMPAPDAADPRWSLELAGGALMDPGRYRLNVMRMPGRRLGVRPAIVAACASQRSPGVDERCDVDLEFGGGITGKSANSMVADTYSFTLRVAG